MRTLLIDNYDSFTYNLFQLLAEVGGAEPIVVRNDEASWEELAQLDCDAVVLSPGPGRPEREADFGVCAEAIARCEAPLLGVCLGHQGIGAAAGAAVGPAPEPVHGRLSTVIHSGSPLFAGIPRSFRAVRYHSLALRRPLPADLEEIATAQDGVPMAVAHRSRPQWGVQFHPESVAAEHGRRLLENFRDLAVARRRRRDGDVADRGGRGALVAHMTTKAPRPTAGRLGLRARRLEGPHDAEAVFAALYGHSEAAFWLDGSRPGPGARFTFMGDASGPLGATVSYDVEAGEVTVSRHPAGAGPAASGPAPEVRPESIFDYLDRELARLRPLAPPELPFEFDCGFAGYLGYELKAECGGEAVHPSSLPDAALVFADRMLAFDHELGHTHLLCLHGVGEEAAAEAWLAATEETLGAAATPPAAEGPASSGTEFRLARSDARYRDEIVECQRLLREGESYEICLTNSIEAEVDADPLDLYRRLRRVNPAPFSAYLRFGGLAVLSSSPERFLRVDRERGVEAKPIKGTCRRGADPALDADLAAGLRESEKNRAENLMIADLLRNDLGSVCEVGSVEVPALMEVETYETVHQLVSTVRGRLRPEATALACVRACFPPGSMVGAPKRRTMEILDDLEQGPRGVYSGAIGYLGLGGGCDLSVAIRAIVLDRGMASIGAGGAIVLQSDPEEELGEMLLKAAAPMRAIDRAPAIERQAGVGRVPSLGPASCDSQATTILALGRKQHRLPRFQPRRTS